jgi:hypothetical protein
MIMIDEYFLVTSVHNRNDGRIFKKYKVLLDKELGSGNLRCIVADGLGNTRDFVDLSINSKFRIVRIIYFYVKLIQIIHLSRLNKEKKLLIHVHDPELIGIIVVQALYRNVLCVYDMHEHFPSQIMQKNHLRFIQRVLLRYVWRIIESRFLKYFKYVIFPTNKFYSLYSNLTATVVHNYPLMSDFNKVRATDRQKIKGKFVYAGGIAPNRKIEQICNLFSMQSEISLDIYGPCDPVYQGYLSQLNVNNKNNVRLCGVVDRNALLDLLADYEYGFHMVEDTFNHSLGVPTKVFEYLMNGVIPIVSESQIHKEYFGNAAVYIDVNELSQQFNLLETKATHVKQPDAKFWAHRSFDRDFDFYFEKISSC